MYFDQLGKVRACCQNTGVYLGDVTEQSSREIWESADAERMRTALEADDYSAGCDFCEWQHREGNDAILFARQFDVLRPDERRPRWPRQMEFSLTNTCNLACTMCNGDWSSTIRAKREGRPPLPAVYGDDFFEQLAEFLPHLDEVEFLGGEPFLGKEPLRVMELLAALPDPPQVTVTTNGTIYTPRVERIVDALKPSIVISLDGITPETYDAIRVGAHLPDVLANLERFRAAVGHEFVSLAHCLMTTNWHEYADLLAFAEDRDLFVGVNVVRFPEDKSLYQLPPEELAHVVDTLQSTTVDLSRSRLTAWDGHLAALAHRLDVISSESTDLGPAHGLAGAPFPDPVETESPNVDTTDRTSPYLRGDSMPWAPFEAVGSPRSRPTPPTPSDLVGLLEIGRDGIAHVLRADEGLPVDLADLDGADFHAVEERLTSRFGPHTGWTFGPSDPADPDRLVIRAGDPAAGPAIVILVSALRDDEGHLVGGSYVVHPDRGGPEVDPT